VNPVETLLAGIAPEHAPTLVAGLLTAIWLSWPCWRWPSLVHRWAGVLLATSAAVHLALPLNAHHGALVNAGFLASGACYAVLARRAWRGRRWRMPAAVLITATLVAYAAAVVGGEEPDQVGVATALVELTAFGLAVVPSAWPRRPRRLARFAGGAATVTAALLVGAIVWVGAFRGHQAPTDGHDHDHHDQHAARAQAGVIMRPLGEVHHPTEAQRQAAAALVDQTKQAAARYTDLNAALADGYQPALRMEGPDVHLEHPIRKQDGAVMDPRRPEMLVYSIDSGRATLLGVVYVMEVAGEPAPTPGGPITRWHAHNLCVSVLPPGLGVVSPYGGCPAFSISVTSPEMMHVWVVDNPAGPFADQRPDG
jgi:hypothetical protein